MVYSSVSFIFYFLPLLLAGYYLMPRLWLKNIFLLLASMVFYAWSEGRFVLLLLSVGLSAWGYACLIKHTRYKKAVAFIVVISYVLLLVFYKYPFSFLWRSQDVPGLNGMAFPLGISFFSFQAISYIIDVYRDNSSYERNPFYVVLYISMFPQLISGPLVRYNSMSQQFRERNFCPDRFAGGIKRFITGLAKKVLIANPLGLLVHDIMQAETAMLSTPAAWLGIVAFALQLYYDFSGYTDMAIGIGKILGFELPENFNHPFISRSVTEFWRRWHITLSGWLKDYVFMPLSLNLRRLKKYGVFLSLVITFTLCGIWHSPGWNFLLWGSMHGLLMGIEQLFLAKQLEKFRVLSHIYTLFVLLLSFVFVASGTPDEALTYFGRLFSFATAATYGVGNFVARQHWVLMAVGILCCLPVQKIFQRLTINYSNYTHTAESLLLQVLLLLSLMGVIAETYNPFLYFKF
ncbi:MAG: Peptidoglycan O-acetyltransferase [Bacteroidetes bacterium ADurb.Bin408]|nr:MAG: Peptidoglycan O-acetyltransferase [Bacteroidetes bacterium ADurb.Bin408]